MQTVPISSLNLARKWRSKTFDTIVGQSLAVRMLKNSLYRDYYFPVYLFAGQRGCGKTTTARIFAAALNCEQLSNFQKNPKEQGLPCLVCDSCVAMTMGNHPDFIEMDAASNTGVDNVRVIIDAASLLPVLGRKKIYLIDEAHMLSKAAFNAFLKILEEPPASVLFMLATTDPHKIIETVRSRCFQLFFRAIDTTQLREHLQKICTEESINADQNGIHLIIRQSQGSARDAINLLEQVRFSAERVDKQAVCDVLGTIPDEQLLQLFSFVVQAESKAVVDWLAKHVVEQYRPQALWDSFLELIRAALWFKYGNPLSGYAHCNELFRQLPPTINAKVLCTWLEIFYSYELLFLKTAAPHRLFETIVLRLCNGPKTTHEPSMPLAPEKPVLPTVQTKAATTPDVRSMQNQNTDARWSAVLGHVAQLDDPLINSVFQQGRFVKCDASSNELEIAFAKEFSFFNEWLENSTALWKPIIAEQFGMQVQFKPLFIDDQKQIVQTNTAPASTTPVIQQSKNEPHATSAVKRTTMPQKYPVSPTKKIIKQSAIDVSDKQKWPTANMLLSYFPGTIVQVQEFDL